MEFWMVAYNPETGEELARIQWPDSEPMDTRAAAENIAASLGVSLSDENGFIPNCCGDLRIEFRRDPDNSAVIYTGESFYFERSE